jgi:hypothetical protein
MKVHITYPLGGDFMWKSSIVPQPNQGPAAKERYYKVQMRAWTNFDPMEKTLAEIADSMDQGNGFLSVVEVLEVAENLASVGDEDVRDGVANILAAKRLLGAIETLPQKLKEELRSALQAGTDMGPRRAKKSPGSAVEELGRAQNSLQDTGTR